MNALSVAMFMGTPEIVEMLFDKGFDLNDCADVNGVDPFMFACVSGKYENMKYWQRSVKSWDVNRRNMFNGSTALHTSVYLGTHHTLDIVQFLIQECGARVDITNNAGSAILMNSVENEDLDPNVVDFIISKAVDVNQKRRSRTMKWRAIRFAARVTRNRSGLMAMLARGSGATALHHATMRGDMEIVEMLLSAGADPSVKNDLGENAISLSIAYPELRGVIKKYTS